MLDAIAALAALADAGTMAKAALSLHITQSAVSKRIAALEDQLDRTLIEKRGRLVALTPAAAQFLQRARPLIAELRHLTHETVAAGETRLTIDLSVSVLISWGAEALAKVRADNPHFTFALGAHHASVAVERVRGGECELALVQGTSQIAKDLQARPVLRQVMVIVPSGLKKPRPADKRLAVMAIEEHTEAWAYIQAGMRALKQRQVLLLEAESRLQSFSAIVQLARAGFGHGLVPLGVALALGVPRRSLMMIPEPGIAVPVSLIGRRTTLARPAVEEFYRCLLRTVPPSERAEVNAS